MVSITDGKHDVCVSIYCPPAHLVRPNHEVLIFQPRTGDAKVLGPVTY